MDHTCYGCICTVLLDVQDKESKMIEALEDVAWITTEELYMELAVTEDVLANTFGEVLEEESYDSI